MRIVSLLPSATDILVALDAANEVVGVSHSCGLGWSHVPRLTSTWVNKNGTSADIDAQVAGATTPLYELNMDVLEALAPDVVISQSLCEVCAIPSGDVEAAIRALPNQPVLVDLSPQRLEDIPRDFVTVAEVIGRQREARVLQASWQASFSHYHQKHAAAKPRVAFLDWLDPPYAAGHWVPDMIEWLGGVSVLARPGQPSYKLMWDDVLDARPNLIVAACCGFDVERNRAEVESAPCAVVPLDGYNNFSRPSPVLMHSIGLLNQVIEAHLSG